jgi:hypothetical protein
MSQDLQPHKVTKPIQLLAAWLLGLLAVDGAFLTGARLIATPQWAPGALVVASILCVPLFLACIFLLQTRFRPEMQEDSYYSKYLAVQQQTRKVSTPRDEAAQLREMLASTQAALTEGLRALDSGLTQIRVQLVEAVRPQIETAEEVVEASQRILVEARNRLLTGEVNVEVNDLLPMYAKLRRKWHGSRIRVANTFGSTSQPPTAPVYAVVSFGDSVTGEAIQEVCNSLVGTGEWYVTTAESPINPDSIYVGSYGYGGQPVAKLDSAILREMSEPTFSADRLSRWVLKNTTLLDADYPTDPYSS